MSMSKKRDVAILGVIFFASQIQPAFAYVDPGSISIVITAVLGAVAAAGYTMRMYVQRVKDFFQRPKKAEPDTADKK